MRQCGVDNKLAWLRALLGNELACMPKRCFSVFLVTWLVVLMHVFSFQSNDFAWLQGFQ